MKAETRQIAASLERIRERRMPGATPAHVKSASARRTMTAEMERELRELNRDRRSIGVVSQVWPRVIRRERLVSATTLRVARGVLTVYVPSASVRFELDRLLRAGGEIELMRALPSAVNVKRIVLRVGEPPVVKDGARGRAADDEDEE